MLRQILFIQLFWCWFIFQHRLQLLKIVLLVIMRLRSFSISFKMPMLQKLGHRSIPIVRISSERRHSYKMSSKKNWTRTISLILHFHSRWLKSLKFFCSSYLQVMTSFLIGTKRSSNAMLSSFFIADDPQQYSSSILKKMLRSCLFVIYSPKIRKTSKFYP